MVQQRHITSSQPRLVHGKCEQITNLVILMVLTDKERKAMLKARLRNLKRKYSKIIQHADLGEEAIDLKADIDALERELKS